MTMEDWAKRLDIFLEFNEEEILRNKGKVSAEIAKSFAESEFEKYRIIQDRLYQSDFDKLLTVPLGTMPRIGFAPPSNTPPQILLMVPSPAKATTRSVWS